MIDKNLDEIEKIIKKLESGDCDFETTLKLYKEGTSLLKNVNESLNEAKAQISIIDLENSFAEKPFSAND